MSVDPALTEAWHDAVAAARGQLSQQADCNDVTIAILRDGSGVRVLATLPSGERAERRVRQPAALHAVLRGLVASSAQPAADERVDSARASMAASDGRRQEAEHVVVHDDRGEPVRESVVAQIVRRPPPRLLANIAVGARAGLPTRVLALDTELRADVFVDAWFISAHARYAPLGGYVGARTIPGYAYDEVAIGVGAGRRFALTRAFDLDVSASPEVVVMTEEGDVPTDGTGGTDEEARVSVCARLVAATTPWRPSFAADFEVAPFAAKRPAIADPRLPYLPTWTVGLRVGVTKDLL